jgi:hypothetical protein
VADQSLDQNDVDLSYIGLSDAAMAAAKVGEVLAKLGSGEYSVA